MLGGLVPIASNSILSCSSSGFCPPLSTVRLVVRFMTSRASVSSDPSLFHRPLYSRKDKGGAEDSGTTVVVKRCLEKTMLRRPGKLLSASHGFDHSARVRALRCFLHQSTCRHQTHEVHRPHLCLPYKKSAYHTRAVPDKFTRSISSSSTVIKRRVSSTPASGEPTEDTLSALEEVKRLFSLPETQLDLYQASDPIDRLLRQNGLRHLNTPELFTLAFRIADGPATRWKPNSRASVNWPDFLDQLLAELGRRRPFSYPPENHWWTCLNASLLALCGETALAQEAITKLDADRFHEENLAFTIALYKHLIISNMRYNSNASALEFYSDHFSELKHLANAFNSQRGRRWHHPAAPGSPFFQLIVSLVTAISSPATFLADSRNVWDKLTQQRIGQLMLRMFCQEQIPEKALAIRDELIRQDVEVETALQLGLVRALVKGSRFWEANALYADLSLALAHDTSPRFFETTGLYLYARQGDVARAESHFDRLMVLDLVGPSELTLIMHAYAVNGDTRRVVQLFDEFFQDQTPIVAELHDMGRSPPHRVRQFGQPNRIHYSTVIFAHAQTGDFSGMNAWLNRMRQAGHKPDLHVYNIILKSFASRGDVSAISTLLDQMRISDSPPDIVSYTIVVTLLAERRDPGGAEDLYRRAIEEGIIPDRQLVTAVMNAHVEGGSWHGVIRAFDYLRSVPARHLRLSVEVFNTLLKAYVFIGTPYHVVSDLFYRMRRSGIRPTAYTFALVIQSACDAGEMDAASDLYLKMEDLASQEHTGLKINVYVMTILMAGYLRQGDKASAKAVYDDMQVQGIRPTSVTYNTILKAYGNEGTEDSLRVAETFLASLKNTEATSDIWNPATGGRTAALDEIYAPVMQAHVRGLNPEEAQRIYSEMIEAGGEPSLSTLTLLLDAYRRSDNSNGALQVWPQIYELGLQYSKADALYSDRAKESPTYDEERQATILCIPFSIYIDALSAAGLHMQVARAWSNLRTKGFKFDSHNWNHMAVALVRAGHPERAFEILEKVILPYQQQVSMAKQSREQNPSSPLLSDRNEDDDDSDIIAKSPLHKGIRRAQAMEMANLHMQPFFAEPQTDDELDYAHPLHILHQIAPSWNAWRVHKAVLTVLAGVLHGLESGFEIRSVKSREETMEDSDDPLKRAALRDTYDKRHEAQRHAADILRRLYENYPKALMTVERWERNQYDRDDDPDSSTNSFNL